MLAPFTKAVAQTDILIDAYDSEPGGGIVVLARWQKGSYKSSARYQTELSIAHHVKAYYVGISEG